MFIKRDYLQYVNSIKEAEEEMFSQLSSVIEKIVDPEILKTLKDILGQEKEHQKISEFLLSAANKIS
ncbi:MAG: hypothetical protein PHQ52_08415 [Candidatus Omnitrophica bacterium]|nr:hypothetical protein [Candidatus Omnitrophota bacterium]